MSTVETKRKCKVCKEYIIFEKEMPVMVDKTTPEYYHYTCFVDFTKKKKTNKLSDEEIEKMAKDLQVKYKDRILWLIDKNQLYKYLQKKYDIVLMPRAMFTTLEQIFTGKYKKMSEPVLPGELLDMWERKESYLDKTCEWKESKGEGFKDGYSKFRYCAAIIMSKVGSYRKWKDEQNANENKNKVVESQTKIDYRLINKTVLNNINSKNKVEEIADYLEEI